MTITTTSRIAAPPTVVFAALIDPAILQRVIPGCESLVAIGDDEYEATLKVGVAGLKGTTPAQARFATSSRPSRSA